MNSIERERQFSSIKISNGLAIHKARESEQIYLKWKIPKSIIIIKLIDCINSIEDFYYKHKNIYYVEILCETFENILKKCGSWRNHKNNSVDKREPFERRQKKEYI